MFERKHQPLAPRRRLFLRMARVTAVSSSILLIALGIGMWGYHALEHLEWLDALMNASMLLGGEGPMHTPTSVAGKWFASFYAIFGSLVFVVASGIFVSPLAHRLLHRFHLESRRDQD